MGAPGISYKKRLLAALGVIATIFVVLIGRLFYIQVVQSDELQERALSQWTRDTSLSAARGSILDTTGVVLAQSGTAYKVVIWPNSIDAVERTRVATELAELLGLEYETVLAKVSDTKKQEIILARRVEREVIDQIAARKLGMGVGTAIDTKRYYPSGTLFSQLLGFTTVDGVGQSGLEQKYDKYLAGEDGRMITETDRKGNALAYGVQEIIEPVDGYNLVLTVDSVYQSSLEKACKEALEVNNAATAQGILMNCKTGAILAITTQPDYDPNDPPRKDAELLALWPMHMSRAPHSSLSRLLRRLTATPSTKASAFIARDTTSSTARRYAAGSLAAMASKPCSRWCRIPATPPLWRWLRPWAWKPFMNTSTRLALVPPQGAASRVRRAAS